MPSVPAPAVKDESEGVNAVLLGPPGSGKGTQVRNSRVRNALALSGGADHCHPAPIAVTFSLQQP